MPTYTYDHISLAVGLILVATGIYYWLSRFRRRYY